MVFLLFVEQCRFLYMSRNREIRLQRYVTCRFLWMCDIYLEASGKLTKFAYQ